MNDSSPYEPEALRIHEQKEDWRKFDNEWEVHITHDMTSECGLGPRFEAQSGCKPGSHAS